MIDAGPSLRVAAGLAGPALVPYLLGTGWSARPSRVDGISIFAKKIEGSSRPIQFILPVKSGFIDEERRVADALRTVSQLEGRSLPQIVADIRRAADPDQTATQSHELRGGIESVDVGDFSAKAFESHTGPGHTVLFKASGVFGADVIEIELIVDEHGRYEALVRESGNKNRPVRFLVENSSNDLREDPSAYAAKERDDPD